MHYVCFTGSSTNITSAAKSNSRPLQHRGNHVASLLACRQPETLAEQLLAQQEHNNELQEQLVSGSKQASTVCVHEQLPSAYMHQVALKARGMRPPTLTASWGVPASIKAAAT